MNRDTEFLDAGDEEAAEAPEVSQEAPAPAKDEGFAGELEKVWNEREAGAESKDEFAEIFGTPERESLKAAGLTPAAYVRNLISIARQIESNPQETLSALANHYQNGGSSGGLVHNANMHTEWERFAKDHPDADRYKMGEWLAKASPQDGETVRQTLTRAYKAVRGSDRAGGKAAGKKLSDNHARRDDIEAVWDQLGHGDYMRSR